jgi:uncharacterized protein (TIGR02145 family)
MRWKAALKACPSGYHLPTKEEFMALLGSCGFREDNSDWCNSCSESHACRKVFGGWTNGPEFADDVYWSSTPTDNSFAPAWFVSFGDGSLDDLYVHERGEDSSIPLTWSVLCVRKRGVQAPTQ